MVLWLVDQEAVDARVRFFHVSPTLDLDWSGEGLAIRAQHARVFKFSRQVQTGGAVTRVAVQVADPEGQSP